MTSPAPAARPDGPGEILVGGQAVLEGVMMKMPRSWAVTVRRGNGELVSDQGDCAPWSERWPILKLPLLRGPAILGQMLGLGMKSLFFATDVLAADEKAQGKGGAGSIAKTTLTLASTMVLQAVADGPDGTEGDDHAPRAAAGGPTSARSEDQGPPRSAESPGRPGVRQGGLGGPLPAGPTRVRARSEDQGPPREKGLGKGELALSILMAVVMFVLVFKALPLGIAALAGWAFPILKAPLAESVISGLALACVFVGYLALLSRFPDIKRMFMYHGAEHELVHVHEQGKAWTVENARPQSTRHPRCGTSFLFFVVLVSIIVWSLIPIDAGYFAKLGVRLALLPLVMGLSFELIRLSARHRDHWFFRALMAPGLWTQGITTVKPDDSMREVSIRSLQLAAARHAA